MKVNNAIKELADRDVLDILGDASELHRKHLRLAQEKGNRTVAEMWTRRIEKTDRLKVAVVTLMDAAREVVADEVPAAYVVTLYAEDGLAVVGRSNEDEHDADCRAERLFLSAFGIAPVVRRVATYRGRLVSDKKLSTGTGS